MALIKADQVLALAKDMAIDLKGYVLAAEESDCGDAPEVQTSKLLIKKFEAVTATLATEDTHKKQNLKGFADAMLAISWDGCDADGAEIQELAEAHGLIGARLMTEKCGENCLCDEINNFPLECFRKTYR